MLSRSQAQREVHLVKEDVATSLRRGQRRHRLRALRLRKWAERSHMHVRKYGVGWNTDGLWCRLHN